jgi:hypothetical protein
MHMNTRVAVAVALSLAAGAAAPVASAMEPIPQEPGLRGFIVAGVGFTSLESNFVAGNSLFELGQPRISSINAAPRSDDTVHAVFTGEINYTFANRWQAFFGTSIEDAVTLDGVTQLGVRKDMGDPGLLQVGYVFSGIPTQTWEDPYAEGVNRKETDRDSDGVRVQWDRALGSDFQFTFTYRDISIERERSGQGVLSVSCDASCQDLLRRDGDQYTFDVSYLYRIGAEGGAPRHLLRPLVRYTVNDREGDAISSDAYRLQLSYVFLGQGYNVASNVAYGASSQDRRNPLFGVKTDSTGFAVDTTLFYRLPIEGGRWQAVASLLWGKEDNDVRFNDNEIFSGSVGAMYRFGAR